MEADPNFVQRRLVRVRAGEPIDKEPRRQRRRRARDNAGDEQLTNHRRAQRLGDRVRDARTERTLVEHVDDHRINMTALDVIQEPQILGPAFLRRPRRNVVIDISLGDRPALTPIENFYQRALAGDSDEALEQAELLLKDRSLSSYYDEIAVKGLQLAANRGARGENSEQ